MNRTAGNTAHTGNALGRIGNGEVIVGNGSHGAFPCTESAGSAIGIDSGNQPGPLRFAVMLSGNWRAGIGAGSEFFEDLLAESGQLLAIGIIGEYIGKIYLETKNRPKYFIETYLEDAATPSSMASSDEKKSSD